MGFQEVIKHGPEVIRMREVIHLLLCVSILVLFPVWANAGGDIPVKDAPDSVVVVSGGHISAVSENQIVISYKSGRTRSISVSKDTRFCDKNGCRCHSIAGVIEGSA